MAKGDGWDGWVKNLKRLAEEVADFIVSGVASSRPDTAVARSAIERAEEGQATGNQTALAAILLAWFEPGATFRISSGFRKLSIAGWADPGETLTGLDLGRRMIRYYVQVGPHGEREPYGYSPMYFLVALLAAAHPDSEIHEGGQRLLVGELALFRLMGGREVGCRVTPEYDKPEANANDLLGLAGVPGFRARKRGRGEAYATSRIASKLWPQLRHIVPSLATVEDAVRALAESGIRCARTWRWEANRDGTAFYGGLGDLSACEGKGGGTGVVCDRGPVPELSVFSWQPGSGGLSWGLELGPRGLEVVASPAEFELPAQPPAPDKPTPPRPEEPEPPDQEPDLAAGVRAVIAWAKDPATAKGRGAKSVLGEVVGRLEGLL